MLSFQVSRNIRDTSIQQSTACLFTWISESWVHTMAVENALNEYCHACKCLPCCAQPSYCSGFHILHWSLRQKCHSNICSKITAEVLPFLWAFRANVRLNSWAAGVYFGKHVRRLGLAESNWDLEALKCCLKIGLSLLLASWPLGITAFIYLWSHMAVNFCTTLQGKAMQEYFNYPCKMLHAYTVNAFKSATQKWEVQRSSEKL